MRSGIEAVSPGAVPREDSSSGPDVLAPSDERLLRVSVALVWLLTGVSVLSPTYREIGEHYLAPLGLSPAVMVATCAGEVLLALLLFVRPTDLWQALVQTAPVLVFTLVLGVEEPRLLVHPFGVVTKNVPLLGAIWAAYLVRREGFGPRAERVLRGTLAAIWITEGLFPKQLFQDPLELDVVTALGFDAATARLLVHLVGAGQIAMGIAMPWLAPRWLRPLLLVQLAALLVLPALVVHAHPEMLVHPFGPLTKNFPILAGTFVLARRCSTSR